MEKDKVIFPEGWAEKVKLNLMKESTDVANDASRKLLRVATPLLDANPYAYTPRFVSLGPYHYGKEPEDVFKANHVYDKIQYAAALCQKLLKHPHQGFNLDEIVAKIEESRTQIETFYECSIPEGDYCKKFALMMAVDSFFLLQFLFGHYRGEHGSNIKCDILMLENQIPLFVLKEMFDKAKGALVPALANITLSENAIKYFLVRKAYMELSPFDITPDTLIHYALNKSTPKTTHPHLLACMHGIVLQFLLTEGVEEKTGVRLVGCMAEPTLLQVICSFLIAPMVEKMCRIFFFSTHEPGDLPINGYSASELARAGIKFKSFSTPSQCIWFDKYSHKLYLPRMTVTYPTQTEVFFRNLLALEVNDADHGNHVRDFIQLMDCLIDTSSDIRTLRKSHVICLGSALSDEGLAKIWDSMHQPFSSGHLEPPEELKLALDNALKKKCCMIKCRIALLKLCNGWYEQYLSKPWNVVGLLVGVFVLTVNIIQAYCSLLGCNFRSSS